MENISKVLVDLFKDDAEYIKENKKIIKKARLGLVNIN